jgi:hypothetical protein
MLVENERRNQQQEQQNSDDEEAGRVDPQDETKSTASNSTAT